MTLYSAVYEVEVYLVDVILNALLDCILPDTKTNTNIQKNIYHI